MQEKNMKDRNNYSCLHCTLENNFLYNPIEQDFRAVTSTTTVSRNRKLYTTSAIDCANSYCSNSSISNSNNSDSTSIGNDFNTGFSYLSSFTPLPKN